MSFVKRIVAALVLILAMAMLAASLAAAIGVWAVKKAAEVKLEMGVAKVGRALDKANKVSSTASQALDRAAQRLKEIQEEHRKIAATPAAPDISRRMLSRLAQQKLGPDLDQARSAAHEAADAASVIGTVLEELGGSIPGLNAEAMTRANSQLQQASSAAWELGLLLGEADQAGAATAQASRIEHAVREMRALVGQLDPVLAEVRARADQLQDRASWWLAVGPPLVTIVGVWIALTQVSVIVHALGWWRPGGGQAGA
jgi:chromosome segregation ATPase